MNLTTTAISPKKIAVGIDILRQMKSLKTISGRSEQKVEPHSP